MRAKLDSASLRELRKRPGVMIAFFGLRRSLRRTSQIRGAPGLVIVIVDKEWTSRFHRASELLLTKHRPIFFSAEHRRYPVATLHKGSKKVVELEPLRSASQAIVISDDLDAVPKTLLLSADEIVDIEKPTARHIQAMRRLTGRPPFDDTLLAELAKKDWDVIDALMCRRTLSRSVMQPRRRELTSASHSSSVKLSQLPGYGPARDWVANLSRDFAAWRTGDVRWSELDRAAVLAGSPGTGKTFFASALAAELGVELVATSAGEWQSAGQGYLGDTLKAMRESFNVARSKGEVLLFVDEMDSIGNRDHRSHNAFYENQVVNNFLELTGRSAEWPGLILVGATNRLHDMDVAILRAGRFETHIKLELPDRVERAEILSFHLGGLSPSVLQPSTDLLVGWSPADLERLARAARRAARDAGRSVGIDDVERSMPPRRKLVDSELHRVAVHECGHAVVALACDFVESVDVELYDAVAAGRGPQPAGRAHYDLVESVYVSEEQLRAQIRILFGGMVAEEVVCGDRSTGGSGFVGSDLDVATDIATAMVASYGLGGIPRFYRAVETQGTTRPLPAAPSLAVDRILQEEWQRTKEMLRSRKEEISVMASRLKSERKLTIPRS